MCVAPRFPSGLILATPGALEALQDAEHLAISLLVRHASGDWGEVGEEDWAANNAALAKGGRLLSAYTLRTGVTLWIITEADRSVTTLLLPAGAP